MNNYSFLEKKLHSILLSHDFLKRTTFFLEEKLFRRSYTKHTKADDHVFVTGLPRSGTTTVLNYLFKTNEFASLTYQDMPFILSPNLWSFFSLNLYKSNPLFERAHKDGIKYNFESPEAFEEVFWKSFSEKEGAFFLVKYINLILFKNKKKRYLSKNNYNYNRVKFIQNILPKSKFLFIFRDPIQTSFSLLRQHIIFSNMQKNDNFIRKYMSWLGHYEFGLDHKAWFKPRKFNDLNSINYWLEQWFLFYNKNYVDLKDCKNIIFINYEDFINDKKWKLINKKLCIKTKKIDFKFKLSKKNNIPFHDKSLYEECTSIYKNLVKLSKIK